MAERRSVAIIGAGPAGLMAAEVIASAGHAVTIFDQMPSPARKFLMAGRGGLNLTHSEPLERFLTRYGPAADWLEPAIRAFSPEDLRAWCESLGQPTFVGSSGRVFPTAMKAAPLLRAWLQRLETRGVRLLSRHRWHGWQGDMLHFERSDGSSLLFGADAVLLALGGASWPRLGSDGGWTGLLAGMGVEITPIQPANCGFLAEWSNDFRQRFVGTPLKPVTLHHQHSQRQGEAMITASGIEGGAVYALSAELREAIARNGSTQLRLDLRPQLSQEALAQKLAHLPPHQSLSTRLKKLGFAPLAIALLRELSPRETLASPQTIAAALKALPLTLTGTTGLTRAISSAGGIARTAVDANFRLEAKPGTFAVGEMLDWEAPTGGYLLQACFSTAVMAAKAINRQLAE